MLTNFQFSRIPLAAQQVRISPASSQPTAAAGSQPAPTAAVSQIAFNHAVLSAAILNLNKSGPIITDGTAAFYNDRFDANKKWYFADFALQQPLQNSFLLVCSISRPDAAGNSTYIGEVSFTLQKAVPAEVTAQIQNNAAVTFSEIPLNNLGFSFTVMLADNTSTSFPCSFEQDQNNFKLTIKLDQNGLIRFYKFISNEVNANYCSIRINASYFGYTQKPQPIKFPIWGRPAFVRTDLQTFRPQESGPARNQFVLPAKPALGNSDDTTNFITNDAMPFVKNIANVNFDCHQFPNNYLTKAGDNTTTIFACKPPFGDDSLARNDYTEFHIVNGSLTGTGVKAVYINVYNGNYLVIPDQYQIALKEADGNTLIPAAYLFTRIDANNISDSIAVFEFNIAPAISGFQLLLLKTLLLQNTPVSLNKTLNDIFVEFPAKIHQPELIQFNKDQIPNVQITMIGAYAHGVDGCNFLSLEFQNVSIGNGNAALIANRLKETQEGMTETIVFEVDSDTDTNPESSIVLSLDNITGKGLDAHKGTDDNLVYLLNKTLLTVSVSSLADRNDQPKSLDPPVVVNPNQAVSTNAVSDVTEIPFAEFQYNYSADPSYKDTIFLKEIRTDAGTQVTDNIIVTNNTGLFAMYNIDHIDFLFSIINPNIDPTKPPNPLTAGFASLRVDGAVNLIPFALPVDQYLSKWSLVYSTLIHFTNNTTPQQNDSQSIDDLNKVGKLINLTVSSLSLQKP